VVTIALPVSPNCCNIPMQRSVLMLRTICLNTTRFTLDGAVISVKYLALPDPSDVRYSTYSHHEIEEE